MPRSWLETVHDWPRLCTTTWNRARIAAVERLGDSSEIRVDLDLLDYGQEGHRLAVAMPLPIRPAGLAADFFQAGGIEVVAGKRIRPMDAIGRTICVRIGPATNQPVDFKNPETPPDSKQSASNGNSNSTPEHKTS